MLALYMLGGVACWFGGWWLWPTGITDFTFVSITLGMLLSAAGSVFLWLTGIVWLLGGFSAMAAR